MLFLKKPGFHLCRCHPREICVRNVLFIVCLMFIFHVITSMVFNKDYSLTSLFTFKWISHPSSNRGPSAPHAYRSIPYNSSVIDTFRHDNFSILTPQRGTGIPLCPAIPPGLVGRVNVDKNIRSWKELEKTYAKNLLKGGRWKPRDCISRHRMAIVIPYRDREMHLKLFVQHMHPLLQKQQLDYGIYVVELAPGIRFNRAMLMNIGYAEASKIYDYQCYIFHDVDLYPEDDRNIYSCPDNPRHMSVAINKFHYKLPYPEIFGGVGALKKEHLLKVNGFSNKFFGWGGEDDDMHNRIVSQGFKIIRYSNDIARYMMMSHKDDKANPERHQLIRSGKRRWSIDGINSLLYKVLAIEYRPLYTCIRVAFNEKEVMKHDANTIKKKKVPTATLR